MPAHINIKKKEHKPMIEKKKKRWANEVINSTY